MMIKEHKGYTLIELTVVIVLVGLLMTFTVPRVRESVSTDNLKASTRRIMSLIYSVRGDAIRDNRGYVLNFDKGSGRYWVESPDMPELERSLARENADALPGDVRIMDITIVGDNSSQDGETLIRFHNKGYVKPALIRLGSDKGKELTMILRPFIRKIEVAEGRVEPEEVRF
ncbi:MAG: type II secretion system protein [Deltaproteobacteria bacterium]|nr:type II secretion system protein [Deltaproteobacteria bacterium]